MQTYPSPDVTDHWSSCLPSPLFALAAVATAVPLGLIAFVALRWVVEVAVAGGVTGVEAGKIGAGLVGCLFLVGLAAIALDDPA